VLLEFAHDWSTYIYVVNSNTLTCVPWNCVILWM